jgi:glycosyltransferase involved in cell wall biosynthesis
MAGHHYYNSPIQVGTHHIARALAQKGWKVAFLSEPITPMHWVFGDRSHLARRWETYRMGGQWFKEGRIWSYVCGAVVNPHNAPLLRSHWVGRHWHRLTWPRVVEYLRKQGFGHVDLLYIESINQAFWLRKLSWNHSVYRLSDNTSGFDRYTAATRAMEREIIQSVDAVLYTARSLEGYLADMEPRRTLYFPNGVDLAHFRGPPPERPPEYLDITGPVAVFVGSIEYWVNLEWIHAAARALPNVTFVLIGSGRNAKDRIDGSQSNLRFLGPRNHDVLSAYLRHADVGLIPFDAETHPDLVHAVNPLKLYEYLACELPVVCSQWDELRNINSPAFAAQSVEQFIEGIQAALEIPAEQRRKYVDFVRSVDWRLKVDSLISRLDIDDPTNS